MILLWLKFMVIAAALFAIGGLVTTMWTTLRFGQRRRFAPAIGSEWQGVQYALLGGMMPWAKESARQHLITWCAGIIYHIGIAAAFVVMVFTMMSAGLDEVTRTLLLILLLVGAVAGIGLLIKRAMTLALRAISTPDDVISNGLVTVFLIMAAITLRAPQAAVIFLIIASIMFLYIPLGKIRHCLLFFSSRIAFGKFFGGRGVLPHRTVEAKESHVG